MSVCSLVSLVFFRVDLIDPLSSGPYDLELGVRDRNNLVFLRSTRELLSVESRS